MWEGLSAAIFFGAQFFDRAQPATLRHVNDCTCGLFCRRQFVTCSFIELSLTVSWEFVPPMTRLQLSLSYILTSDL
jgi:hypothetical protein